MRKLVVLAALLATVGVSCVPPPTPPPPTGGTGCRELRQTGPFGNARSIRWDGTYDGRFELFENATCDGAASVRWAAYRLPVQGDVDSTYPVANARCTELATAALPPSTWVIGPFTYRYQEFLAGEPADTTGVPQDLWMCAAPFVYEGVGGNWPTDEPTAPA
jgi:hypothetical protein